MTELERQQDVILGRIERLSGELAMKDAIHGLRTFWPRWNRCCLCPQRESDDARRAIEELEAAIALERISLGNVLRAIEREEQQ